MRQSTRNGGTNRSTRAGNQGGGIAPAGPLRGDLPLRAPQQSLKFSRIDQDSPITGSPADYCFTLRSPFGLAL